MALKLLRYDVGFTKMECCEDGDYMKVYDVIEILNHINTTSGDSAYEDIQNLIDELESN